MLVDLSVSDFQRLFFLPFFPWIFPTSLLFDFSKSRRFFQHNLCLQKVAHGIHSPWCKISRHGHMITLMLMFFFSNPSGFWYTFSHEKKTEVFTSQKRWWCGGWPWGGSRSKASPPKVGVVQLGAQLSDRRSSELQGI